VKFPPHIKVESKVLGKATYFYLKNDEVMASLRVWNGDIEPVSQLEEVWVQITSVPLKWCDWTTINEIASSLGKPEEIDWQTLFSSFFSQIRVKFHCKDPRMIPESRIMEMENRLYMIHFKVENYDKEAPYSPRSDGKGDDSDDEDENPEDDPKKSKNQRGRMRRTRLPIARPEHLKRMVKKRWPKGGKGLCKKLTQLEELCFWLKKMRVKYSQDPREGYQAA
jgi:hypothetical protein